MENFEILKTKLEAFIRKFYMNELLKGLILFLAIGLLYFLLTLFVEYMFWLDPGGRRFLFWSFVAVELLLFGRFILYPLLKLFKLTRGIDYSEASVIIGKHFPTVKDKLLNLLQLKDNPERSELLLASVDQKAEELRPIPFSMAIDFRKNLPFLKYASIPLLLIIAIVLSGRSELFTNSYDRVINYKTAYLPPAPFIFKLQDSDLRVRENEILHIQVATVGKVIPENVSIHYNDQSYFLNEISPGIYEHSFEPVQESFSFYFSGNELRSPGYEVEVVEVPKIKNLGMRLDYPAYTGLEDEVVQGTGNATVPEGTVVHWILETQATENVSFITRDTTAAFEKREADFSYKEQVLAPLKYEIRTANRQVKDFENLSYQIDVSPDEYPRLDLESRVDSLDKDTQHFHGRYSDDFGIRKVQLVVLEQEQPNKTFTYSLNSKKGNVGEFWFSFPDTLSLNKGTSYNYYFEVIDNDAIHGFKRVKSELFHYREKSLQEEKEEQLLEQGEAIKSMDGTLEEMEFSKKELEQFDRLQKENLELDYAGRKKLEDFIKRQKQQNRIMESHTEKLKRNLEKDNETGNEELKDALKERLSNREEALRENEKILEELEKYTEKLEEEGLSDKLDKLSKNTRNQERNMEQLLELTKKYYVQEKAKQIADELEKLSGEQEKLANEEGGHVEEAQEELNQETREQMEDLEELDKENTSLKKPSDLGRDEALEKEVKEQQKQAQEMLEKGGEDKKKAGEKQKEAADGLKMLSKKMRQQMQEGGMKQMQEDATTLRQILDNLVIFSFEQEELMERFKTSGREQGALGGKLRRQDLLKEHFQHVDDSLYALALRNEMISETITKKITDIDYNLDQALDRLSQNEISQGIGSQQYVITGANDLAYLLSQALGKMEQMLSPGQGNGSGGAPQGKAGEGEGQGQQLQDIIKKQGQLGEQMEKASGEAGKKKGDSGESKGGQSEEDLESLFKIFQEQQMLRKALEEKMKEEGMPGNFRGLKNEMEQIEKEILEKGFNPETSSRMQAMEHKLMELENALLEQGKDSERESKTGKEAYKNETKDQSLRAREYFKVTEILNRQSLPLRQIYKLKVKEYFERGNN